MVDPPTFVQRCDAIAKSKPSRFHTHEGRLSVALECRQRNELDNFVLRLEHGGTGSKAEGTWTANLGPYDGKYALKNKSVYNDTGLHYEWKGNRAALTTVSEPSPDVVDQKGRWFCFGGVGEDHKANPNLVILSAQIDVLRFVCGTHRSLNPVWKARRQEQWRWWALGDGRGKDYELLDSCQDPRPAS